MVRRADATGEELAQRFRQQFPELSLSDFEDSLALFRDDDGRVDPCGVLAAFSWEFRRWLANGEAIPVRRALEVIDELLSRAAAVKPPHNPPDLADMLENAILTCFVENIVEYPPYSPEYRALVMPNLGPVLRQILEHDDSDAVQG